MLSAYSIPTRPMVKDTVSVSLPESRTVGKYTVKKLVLRDYVTVLPKLKKIPEILMSLDSLDNASIMAKLPQLVSEALPEVADVLSVATGVPAEKLLDEVDITGVAELLSAFFELNDFLGAVSKFRGMGKKKEQGQA